MSTSDSPKGGYFRPFIHQLGGDFLVELKDGLSLNSKEHARKMFSDDHVPGHYGLRFVRLARERGIDELTAERYLELLELRKFGPARGIEKEVAHG